MIAALGGSDAHLSAVDMWSAGIVTTAVHLTQWEYLKNSKKKGKTNAQERIQRQTNDFPLPVEA